jgi:nucleoside-diphosphate-sugar epimerase
MGQHRRSLDISRAREEFAFEAGAPFEEELRRIIEWYREARVESYTGGVNAAA